MMRTRHFSLAQKTVLISGILAVFFYLTGKLIYAVPLNCLAALLIHGQNIYAKRGPIYMATRTRQLWGHVAIWVVSLILAFVLAIWVLPHL